VLYFETSSFTSELDIKQTLNEKVNKMVDISVLNIFFLPFQILGLQTFTLRNIKKSVKSKYPGIIFILVHLCWIAIAIAFTYFSYESIVLVLTVIKNFVDLTLQRVSVYYYFLIIFNAVIATIWNHSKLFKFFKNFQELLSIFDAKLNCSVNLKRLMKSFVISFIVLALASSCYVYNVATAPWSAFTMFICARIYSQFIPLKFNYLVQIVNFSLDLLIKTIDQNLKDKHQVKVTAGKWKICPQNFVYQHKIVAMRRIYQLIKEMEKFVNDSMGYLMLLQIFIVSVEMINFGNLMNKLEWKNILFLSEFDLKVMKSIRLIYL
jgi:hypothetical protein